MSEESPIIAMQVDREDDEGEADDNEELERFQMRRTWESR